jgi:hypothetical protein
VHVTGTFGTGAEAQGVDLQLQGEDVSGTIDLGGQQVELLTLAGVTYFKAPAEFWATSGAPAESAAQLAGKWVLVPEEEAAGLDELTLGGLADELRSPSDGAIEDAVATEQLDGQDVLVLSQVGGSKLYVATGDPAYPLKTVTGDAQPETLTLDGFGETMTLTAPTDAIDLAQAGA